MFLLFVLVSNQSLRVTTLIIVTSKILQAYYKLKALYNPKVGAHHAPWKRMLFADTHIFFLIAFFSLKIKFVLRSTHVYSVYLLLSDPASLAYLSGPPPRIIPVSGSWLFVLWPAEVNQAYLCDYVYETTCWSLKGTAEGTQLGSDYSVMEYMHRSELKLMTYKAFLLLWFMVNSRVSHYLFVLFTVYIPKVWIYHVLWKRTFRTWWLSTVYHQWWLHALEIMYSEEVLIFSWDTRK